MRIEFEFTNRFGQIFSGIRPLICVPTRRFVYIALVIVALAVGLTLGLQSHWERKQPAFDVAKLIPALQAFGRDRAAGGQPLPLTISLSDLVAGGYLSVNDVAAFRGADVTFYTSVDVRSPHAILARARMPDGTELVVLADGSVQGLAPENKTAPK